MNDIITEYGYATLNDLNDLLGETKDTLAYSKFAHSKLGWTTVLKPPYTGASDGSYTLFLPTPVEIPRSVIDSESKKSDDVGTDGY